MVSASQASCADIARSCALGYVERARASGKATVTIKAGRIHGDLGWSNRVPSVCSALDSQKFRRLSGARLVQRRGPLRSTTAEWTFEISDGGGNGRSGSDGLAQLAVREPRRVVALWDGATLHPAVPLDELEPGERVVLMIQQVSDVRELAGDLAECVGTLTDEEADEMERAIEEAFETISDDW